MNKQKQPIPGSGYSFTGWAAFNWGMCLNRTFRTRKEAQEYCVKQSVSSINPEPKWNDVKGYYHVCKVDCIVI